MPTDTAERRGRYTPCPAWSKIGIGENIVTRIIRISTHSDGNESSMHDVTSALEYWPSPPPWGWTADDLDRLPSNGPNGEPEKPVVHVYELDPLARAYSLTGIHHGKPSVTVPFPIDIDLDALPW